MARTVTILQVMDRARERADVTGTDGAAWIPDAELQRYVDAAHTELYDLLVKHEIHQFETTATVTTVSGTPTYALPADHYKMLALDYRWTTDRYVSVPEVTFAERNVYSQNITSDYGARAAGYRIVGANLVLLPTPASVQVYKHIYVPRPTDISAVVTSTTIDGVSGWDELLVVLAAKLCYIKEQSVPSDLRADEAQLRDRIAQSAVNRGQVQSIADMGECW